MKGVTHGIRIRAEAARATAVLRLSSSASGKRNGDLDEDGADGPDRGAAEPGPERAILR